MPDLALSTELRYVKHVGERAATPFAKLGLSTVRDLLFHFPKRYEDRRRLPPIASVRPGETATVRGTLRSLGSRPSRRRGFSMLRAVLGDGTGSIALVWFNQPWVRQQLERHTGEVIAYGLVREGSGGLEMSAPEWELLDEAADSQEFARLTPVYGLTEGLYQKTVRRAARVAVEACAELVEDALPPEFRLAWGVAPAAEALRAVHLPESIEQAASGRLRFVFEEFFYLQLSLAMNRAQTAEEQGVAFPIEALLSGVAPEETGAAARPVAPKGKSDRRPAVVAVHEPNVTLFGPLEASAASEPLMAQFSRLFPHELTGAQRRVVGEILADMGRPHPMNRLVQGDVGSGKTAVAAVAILAAIRSGYQAVLMAPTEILAEQHFLTMRRLFEPLGVTVAFVAGKLGARERARSRNAVSSGEARLAVGTHALIEEGVEFRNLGLVVVDEQHRFGVMQRAALREKGKSQPDVLVLTATPIPRTLTMTIFGDLDVSVLDELPPGRRPIRTHVKRAADRPAIYASVAELVAQGRQAYFVCPLVDASEAVQAHAAEELYERLRTSVFPQLRLGLMHGKLPSKEKEAVMEAFRAHVLDVLVSTTVVEVGVDVPNATIMVIEDAERFGLAQLHQLRGRVGRGTLQSYCVLVASGGGADAGERLGILGATTDGFEIAETDMRLRGPGEIVGTRQSGHLDFKFGNLVEDGMVMRDARAAAEAVVAADPRLEDPAWRAAAGRVKERRDRLAMLTVT